MRSVSAPPVPSGYSEISNIAVDKPGRRLYNVRGPSEVVSILLQIDASDGNKVMTVRSPLQVSKPPIMSAPTFKVSHASTKASWTSSNSNQTQVYRCGSSFR